MRKVLLIGRFFFLFVALSAVQDALPQTISYIIPDIGTTGQNTYVELISPYNTNGNFGTDGVYNNNPGDPVRVVCVNNSDTGKIKIGPVVVSWSGKLISTQVFVMPWVIPNSTNWQLLSAAYKIPLQVVLNGTNFSNADTFYIVQPQSAIVTSGTAVLGSGGGFGIRSRRGAMLFDSLIFQSGANITLSTADCDPFIAGNQGYLPAHIFSLGKIEIDNGAIVSVSALGGQNPDGGPGGGGGGTESYTNNIACGAGPNIAGGGFTGGGTERACCTESAGAGTGAASSCTGCGKNSLNGVLGGGGSSGCADEDVGAGGTGHPFGTSGTNGPSPGGYGGGSGWSAYAGGGYASNGIAIIAGSEGKANGNMEIIPFAGGSGGSGGVAGPGTTRGGGGGGGGALSLHAFFSSNLLTGAQVNSNGGNGVSGHPSYRGGAGGSGGAIYLSGKLTSQGSTIINVSGGVGGIGGAGQGGSGGAGRVRVDGAFTTSPVITPVPGANSSTSYTGPTTDTSRYVARSFTLTGTGNGQPLNIYLKPLTKPWQLFTTVIGYGTTWNQNITLPCPDTIFLLAVLQQVSAPNAAQYTAEPAWIFSQAGANIFITSSQFNADFIADSVCMNYATTFTDLSYGTSGAPVQWNWNFGDGNSSALQNPGHTYTAGGNYTATLISNDVANCPDTISKMVTVYSAPIANFAADTVCSTSSPTHFTDFSTGAVQWTWDFGDTGNSIFQNPSHPYAVNGIYNVSLIATNSNGCADTIANPVLVNAGVFASFSSSNVCFPTDVVFNNTSTGPVATYVWSFGDGQFSTQQNPSHNYTAAGTYNVTMLVASANNCADTVTHRVVINPKPVADFTVSVVCNGVASVFTNNSSVSSGNIVAYAWDFGDGGTGTQQNLSRIYSSTGTFNTILIVQTDSSCSDTINKVVVVNPNPVADFTSNEVCKNLSTVFNNTTSIASGTIVQWTWNFADGQTDTQQNPSHIYQYAGIYNVTLVAVSDNNCSDTALQTATVDPLPLLNFSAPNVCLGNATMFTNFSSITAGTINVWNWNFGNGNTSSVSSPSNTYTSPGIYAVKLLATSDKNCEDSLTKNISVFDIPVASTTTTPACYTEDNGSTAVISMNGTPPYTYLWSNGQTGISGSNFFAGTYYITVTDANNCTATVSAIVTEPAGPLTLTANPNAPEIELGENIIINLGNSYNTAATYLTSPSYGLGCTDCAQLNATPYQTTIYTVTVTDSNGCKGNGEFTVKVNEALPVFIPNVFTPNGDGNNDMWGVYSRAIKFISIKVFNRWGEKVFDTENMNELWDGTFMGKPSPPGVYVYEVEIVYLNNKTRTSKGSVTLMR